MDIATGKVSAPTLNMTRALRRIPEDQLENFWTVDQKKIDQGAVFVERPDETRAVGEDIAPYATRHRLDPMVEDSPHEPELVFMVPQGMRGCVDSYEDDARAIIQSLRF